MDRQPSSDQRWLWRAGLIAVAVTALAAVMLSRDGTGCRPPPDDEPEPACEPGDNTCKAGEPAPAPAPSKPVSM